MESVNAATRIVAEAAAKGRGPNKQEAEAIHTLLDEADRLGTIVHSKLSGGAPIGSSDLSDPSAGYGPFAEGEFLQAVTNAGMGRSLDPRLIQATAGDLVRESAGADGGYALPVDKRQLEMLLGSPEALHGLCDQLTTQTNAVTLPTDEDPDWSSTMAGTDVAEGAALTEQKPILLTQTLPLVKRGVLVRVTGEMVEDVLGIEQYVLSKSGRKLNFKLGAVAFATWLASPAKITNAKTAGAAAGSPPDIGNLQKMWAQMLPEHQARAIWVMNPQLEPALQSMRLDGAAGGTFPLYVPPAGVAGAPYSTIYGRPVLKWEGSPAIGTEGDFMLVCPSAFWCVMKANGPRSAASIHYEFAKDIVAYRSYVRMVCASKFSAPILRGDGVAHAGNVVSLATRA